MRFLVASADMNAQVSSWAKNECFEANFVTFTY